MQFNEDGRRQARLYEAAGPPHGYGDMRETTPADLAVAATAKAKRQRLISLTIFLVVLALVAAYLIVRILMK